MQVIKALIGGLIGGGIGAFTSGQIQSAMDMSSPWFLIIVGLGTGIGARLSCGSDRTFASGLAGALAAIGVMFGSSYMDAVADVATTGDPVDVDKLEAIVAENLALAESAGDEADSEFESDATSEAEETEDNSEAESEQGDAEDAELAAIEDEIAEDVADESAAAAAPAKSQFDWLPVDFLANGASALLAFALASGSAGAGGGSRRDDESGNA